LVSSDLYDPDDLYRTCSGIVTITFPAPMTNTATSALGFAVSASRALKGGNMTRKQLADAIEADWWRHHLRECDEAEKLATRVLEFLREKGPFGERVWEIDFFWAGIRNYDQALSDLLDAGRNIEIETGRRRRGEPLQRFFCLGDDEECGPDEELESDESDDESDA
jgi:hypothetical protein